MIGPALDRVTSTQVESITTRTTGVVAAVDHPHVRGERLDSNSAGSAYTGSPPRTWRARARRHRRDVDRGITFTWARRPMTNCARRYRSPIPPSSPRWLGCAPAGGKRSQESSATCPLIGGNTSPRSGLARPRHFGRRSPSRLPSRVLRAEEYIVRARWTCLSDLSEMRLGGNWWIRSAFRYRGHLLSFGWPLRLTVCWLSALTRAFPASRSAFSMTT